MLIYNQNKFGIKINDKNKNMTIINYVNITIKCLLLKKDY